MMHSVIYVLQAMSLALCLFSTIYIMKRKVSFEQKLMLTLIIDVFIYNFGALLRLDANNIYEAEIAYKITNLAYSYLGTLYFLFFSRYLKKKVRAVIYWALIIESSVVAVFTTFFMDSDLYYKITAFSITDGFPYLIMENGPLLYVDIVFTILILVYGVVITVYALAKCQSFIERKRIRALVLMVVVVAIGYAINSFCFPNYIDILPITLGFDSLILVYAAERYNFVDIVSSTRERIFDAVPNAIFAFDEKMNITDVNPVGARLFPDIAECKGHQIPQKYAFLLENPEDKLNFKHEGIHFERQFTPVMYRGSLTGYGIILIDVTHTHQMMLQMRELKHKADVASESKSSFLANMSHEIRTPMNAIIGYTDLLSKEITTREGRDYAEAIKSSSGSLLHIINDLLDFSKIEQGKMEIVEDEYETVKLFDEVNDIMQIQAEKKGLKLVVSVDPSIPSVLYGDKMRLRQILLNVMGNAVKFTDQGSIRVMAEWEALEPDKANLSIVVSDTGIGIKPEHMEHIFKEFEQFDIRTNFARPGTGIGLTLTKSLLEMMGGTIDLESEYGVGTSVIISIAQRIVSRTPIANAKTSSTKEQGKAQTIMAPDAKILVVDDNRVNLELMNNYLKQYRIIPDLAESGAQSVELAAKNYYDIIFMDQMMPEMDGIEAMKRIRALGGRNGGDITIIALTANAIAGTRNMLLAEGFTDYASKPLPIKSLEYLLTKYLPKGTYTISAEINETGRLSELAEEVLPTKRVLELPEYIDQKIGMTNAGEDLGQYRSVVEIVYKYADEKVAKIRELLKAEDYPNYTIEVHALKSNAATVGAMRLSEKARALETAGKEGNVSVIKRDSDGFLSEYEQFAADLKKCLEHESVEGTSSPAETPGSMSAEDNEYMMTFDEIETSIKESRYDDAMDLFGVLEFFDLPPVTAHAVKTMKNAAEQGDFAYVLEIIGKLR